MKNNLYSLFHPKSIAVIGASSDRTKVGGIVLANILESKFPGKVYPVNLKRKKVQGIKAYPGVADLPEVVDLAIIATPSSTVATLLSQIGEKKIHNVVIYTAGYKEMSPEGKKAEKEIEKLADEYKMNILGPNCLGFLDTSLPLNATFAQTLSASGNLLILSQSGAIASSVFDWVESTGVGIAQCITLGNKAVLSENEVLEYWKQHVSKRYNRDSKSSKVFPIGMYLESIEHGETFISICKELSAYHPIFLLKPGKSAASKKAMQSHTGAIAGEDSVLAEALDESGVIRCHGIEDFFDLAKVFSWESPPKGPRIAVVSNAGGPAVISADVVSEEGLKLAKLSAKTKELLEKSLPRAASVFNPIDVLGDALSDRYESALEAVLVEDGVDIALVILTPQVMTEIEETAKVISRLSKKYNKPILCSFMGGSRILVGEKYLHDHKIPSFRFPERAIWAASKMWQWQNWKEKTTSLVASDAKAFKHKMSDYHSGQILLHEVLSAGRFQLGSAEADKLISTGDVPTPPSLIVESLGEAEGFARNHGYPLVLKLSSPKLIHKKDVGGVVLDIDNRPALEAAYRKFDVLRRDFADTTPADIWVQKQVESGVEMIVGVKKDASFGEILLFGAGGTLAELVNDRNLLLAPFNKKKVMEAIKNSKVYTLLSGYRGDRPVDIQKVAEAMLRLTSLAAEHKQISEIEINPLIAYPDRVMAVDVKVVLKEN